MMSEIKVTQLPEGVKKQLIDVIKHRVVCFVGLGESLKELDDNIGEFQDLDVCWASLNEIDEVEKILSKIGKSLDIILGFPVETFDMYKDKKCLVHRYSEARGCSLSEFLLQLIACGINRVFLFGCDGYSSTETTYYKGASIPTRTEAHKRDCDKLNKEFPEDTVNTHIYNTSIDSKYKFNKVCFAEAIKMIKSA